MTKRELVAITATLSSAYNITFTVKEKMDIWYECLKDLEFEITMLAVKKLITTFTYMPTIADIRKACIEVTHASHNIIDAVSLLNTSIQKFGLYRQAEALALIKSNDLILHQIVLSIGYRNICTSDFRFLRPEVEKLYNQILNAEIKNEMLPDTLKQNLITARENIVNQNLLLSFSEE